MARSPPLSAMLLLAQAFGRALKLAEGSTGWLLHALYEKQASNFSVPAVLYKSHSVAFAEGGKEGEGRAETEKTGRPISGGRKEAIGGGGGEEKGERVEN